VFSVDSPPLHIFVVGEEREIAVSVGTLHFVEGISALFDILATLSVSHLHCEGGGELIRSLLELDLVDRLYLTWNGSQLFGGRNAPSLTGVSQEYFPQSLYFSLKSMDLGEEGECFLQFERNR
jgi:2,5-diamino-6-(ribosylamino)-4(3H)-pyrimidinone 5'-phosphate reductase